MTSTSAASSDRLPRNRVLPLLLLLFIGSGCAALIYEIIWFQLLELIIGSSAISLGVLLGAFMGGMCLGSLALPRLVSARWHPLRVYAWLEIGIGLFGLALLFALPFLDELYARISLHGWSGILLRALVAAICLLPPTLLMGATLPAVARWVEATPQGISWLGFFYGGNIAGAVLGCLLAGFYLLRVYDMAIATYTAAAINALVAIVAFALSKSVGQATGSQIQNSEFRIQNSPTVAASDNSAFCILNSAFSSWSIYLIIFLSGLTALGAEVIWTRLLSLLLGGTVYTFSIILAVFLIGLGLGSSLGSLLARGTNPRLALGLCQLLLTVAIAWTAFTLTQSLPYWPIDPSLARSIWHTFQLDLLRCLWAVLPPAFLWGASFPLALAAAAATSIQNSEFRLQKSDTSAVENSAFCILNSEFRDPARLVASIYAANTLGAILGALAFSTLLVGWIGVQGSQQLLVVFSALAALIALVPLVKSHPSQSQAHDQRGPLHFLSLISIAAAVVAALWLATAIPPTPGELIAHGRRLPTRSGQYKVLAQAEGQTASIAITELDSGVRNFHVSGKIEASSEPQDMRLQRMLGHIPALMHPRPRSVLVVGCGAGVTAGSFLCYPTVERVVICEIEPLIPPLVAKYFDEENYGVVTDDRVEIVYDDARHYVLTTREKFDVITSDPIHPWVKGAATLYTREYFERCKQRLNPGGVISQWVPLYESSTVAVKSELATFFHVFPGGTLWSNDQEGLGYDTVLLGQVQPLTIDLDQLQERLERRDHLPVALSLHHVGFRSALDLIATFAGTADGLQSWLADAQINRDRNLRLQYLAGTGANTYREYQIYNEILKFRKYPSHLFTGSDETLRELKRRLNLTDSNDNEETTKARGGRRGGRRSIPD